MNNLLKNLKDAGKVLLVGALTTLLTFTTAANDQVFSLVAATAKSCFTVPVAIENITILATTTNATTVKFYDSNTTSTNYVQAAYTSYSSYATNYDNVFTNASGLLVTNTFRGVYTAATSNSASTNERPKILTVVVPASSQYSRDIDMQTLKGLTVLSDAAATMTVTYHNVR